MSCRAVNVWEGEGRRGKEGRGVRCRGKGEGEGVRGEGKEREGDSNLSYLPCSIGNLRIRLLLPPFSFR